MSRFSILASLLIFFVLSPSVFAQNGLRQSLNFNREWTFLLGDSQGAEAVGFNDSNWERTGLPHSFSIPYFRSDNFYVGYGWYRKRFDAPAQWTGKRVHLEFDGVFQVAEIFVNGSRVGQHNGGYTGFTFDITDFVKRGANVLAVRVNNQWNARLAPRAGEHVFSGGIYRNVRLVVTAPVHIPWYGTFVTTPQVSKASGTVNVKTEAVNASNVAKSVRVRTRVLDAAGKTVAEMQSPAQSVPAKSSVTFDQTSRPIVNPRLWHPNHPYLYSVRTTVLDGGRAVDEFTSPLGFRWFKFTADQGFFLNGEHFYFKGANVHQDHAGWGDAVTDNGIFRDAKMVKDAGMDFIRGSHYPHAPALSKACDELGLLFLSENAFWGTASFKSPWAASAYPTNVDDEAEFEASVKQQLAEMIRIHRNHPSIIGWSMDNEVFFSEGRVMPKVRRFLTDLVAETHKLDATRPAIIGGAQRGEIDKLGDVAGYNGDGARLFANPGIPSIVTEYAWTMEDRPGPYAVDWGELPRTPGADPNKPGSWRLPWRSGEVLWCAFDHGSIAGAKFGGMGIVDYFRLPKRQWYAYRNEYKKIPPPAWPVEGVPAGLKLVADKTTLRAVDGTDDVQLIVTVVDANGKALSNSPPVTLTIESGLGEFPTGPSISFAPNSDIVIRDGMAAMAFRSYYAGRTLIRATSPGLKDATVVIISQGGPAFVAGKTPSAKPRPYVRFTENAQSSAPVTVGRDNPTRASSEAPGHSGRLANDGNSTTFWQAAQGDQNPWLTLDMERIVTVSQVKLIFPTGGEWRYRVELSADGSTGWRGLGDDKSNPEPTKDRTLNVASAIAGRFVRVTITGTPTGQPPSLAEVEVTGTINR